MNKSIPPNCNSCEFAVEICTYVGETFDCPGCGRTVPWCFGCSGDMSELCDDCWWHVTELRERYA